MTWKRVKRVRSHAGHFRLLDALGEPRGWIPLRAGMPPSPYHYSPVIPVYLRQSLNEAARGSQVVIVRETSHKVYDVFEVPRDCGIFKTMEGAEAAFVRERKETHEQTQSNG